VFVLVFINKLLDQSSLPFADWDSLVAGSGSNFKPEKWEINTSKIPKDSPSFQNQKDEF